MVSFQCDGCADTVKKPQLDKHRQRCWAPFTCLDCSATFHGQDYKSHTSCVSEAEKYQGALYKGPKTALVKGAHAPRSGQASRSVSASVNASAAVSGVATPADSPAPSESGASGTNTIHPSRLNQLAAGPAPERDFSGGRGGRGFGRGGFNARGRGAFGRGGFGGGFTRERYSATGENKLAPEGGMRTWGSAPASEANTDTEATPVSAPAAGAGDEDKKKKKKRKGDKGGTGAKANSRVKGESEAGDEPQSKKRKRDDADDEAAPATVAPAERAPPSDKTLKRLRKHMGKLEGKTPSASVSLAQWLELVAKGKDKTIDQHDVLQGVHVTFTDGQWTLAA